MQLVKLFGRDSFQPPVADNALLLAIVGVGGFQCPEAEKKPSYPVAYDASVIAFYLSVLQY